MTQQLVELCTPERFPFALELGLEGLDPELVVTGVLEYSSKAVVDVVNAKKTECSSKGYGSSFVRGWYQKGRSNIHAVPVRSIPRESTFMGTIRWPYRLLSISVITQS